MPVFHFTFHAYRSWNADHPEGHYRHRQKGVFAPNTALAAHRDTIAIEEPFVFTHAIQLIFLSSALDICQHQNWRLHGLAANSTHVHVVASWKSDESLKDVIWGKLKRNMSRAAGLSLHDGPRKRFSRGASKIPVRTHAHLHQLLHSYLPNHDGIFWREGMDQPRGQKNSTDNRP